jgi:hypothetical protein
MKRQLPGLHEATPFPDGFFLVRVAWAQYRTQSDKPFLALNLIVTEPSELSGRKLSTRLYCTDKALWKLNWFLRDFGYDNVLLERDEIDDRALVGLRGVVRVSHSAVNGRTFLNLDGFAPATDWDEFRLKAAG